MCFEFKQLRFALAAAEHRSFRSAAEALDIDPSALGRQIRQVEDKLGAPIFERTTQGVRPTSAGEEFLATALRIRREMDRLKSAANTDESAAGRLRIGFYTSLVSGTLKSDLVSFARNHPRIALEPFEASRHHLLSDVADGRLDLAVVTGAPEAPGLRALPLWSERLFVACAERHPFAAKTALSWIDIGASTVLFSTRDPDPDLEALLQSQLIHAVAKPKVRRLDIDPTSVRSLVAGNLGISLVYEACLGSSIQDIAYRELFDSNGPARIDYSAYWREDNQSPALSTYLDALRQRHPIPARIQDRS